MADAYRDDLAYIHDAGFGHVATHAATELLAALAERGIPQGQIVELGCGSGILAQELVAIGYQVLGIDISAAMIALARKRVPQAQFKVGSFRTAELPTCVAVTAIGEVFNYLFDGGNTRAALAKVLERIYAALRPGGLLLFDVAGPGRLPPYAPRRRHIVGPDWAILLNMEEDRKRHILTRHITTFRQVGDQCRKEEEIHRLRLYEPDEITTLLKNAGFRVRVLDCYAKWKFPPGWAGFLARKG
jgi:SAM-dependent methyltransferase